MAQNFSLTRRNRPSGCVWAMPTAAFSNVPRNRSSLSRRASSVRRRSSRIATWFAATLSRRRSTSLGKSARGEQATRTPPRASIPNGGQMIRVIPFPTGFAIDEGVLDRSSVFSQGSSALPISSALAVGAGPRAVWATSMGIS